MNDRNPTGKDWSDSEINLIAADYFGMLPLELAGQSFIKLHRNKALQELTGRSKGSIEFKHQNISAVLRELGMPWIIGDKPLPNYQGALVDGVERILEKLGPLEIAKQSDVRGLSGDRPLFFEPPPARISDRENTTEKLERLIRKFDPAARDERNRRLGKDGEERILLFEKSRLKEAGCDDLARKVRWVS